MTITHKLRAFCATFLITISIYAQDDAKIKPIADKACECLTKMNISEDKDKVMEEANNCIRNASLTRELPIEVQRYMMKNCPKLKEWVVKAYGQNLSANKEALKYYVEGRNYANKDQYDLAVVSYKKAVAADPEFTAAYSYLGDSYSELGKYNDAINCYKKSLAIKPDDKEPLRNMARAYEQLGDYKQASALYEKFIAAFPGSPEGYYDAGRTFCMMENYEKGTGYLMKAYKMYKQANSPYITDTKKALDGTYKILKQKGRLDIFTRAAKNNNFEF